MGSGSTKILSYEEASKRFFQTDLERIEITFRELTNGTNELSYTNFKRDVFANFLPEKLVNRLYQLYMNSSRTGLSYKDLICCLGLIYYGTQKERMQLLYAIFTQTGILYWYDVEEFLRLCGDQLPKELENFFQKNEIVTQEKFLQWLEHNQGHTTTITDWLMDEQRLFELLTYTNDRIYDQYSILAGVTHCTQQQITPQIFSNIISSVLPSILISSVFEAFDENQDGCIDFKEFACGISAACRGPQCERYKFLFRVFDRDHDGVLNYSDIIYMTSCLIEIAQFVYASDMHVKTSHELYADMTSETNQSILKPEDFLLWCQKDRLIIELLDLIFQICHVVLGLRPSSQQDELTIVKHFLQREKYPFNESEVAYNRATSKPGASWFLISMDWWLRWETICSSSIINSNELKNKKISSIKSNKTDNKNEHGDIDNSSLIEKIISNDCVQLKTNLRRGIHFEMIPELLWIFLRKYYRCNGPIVCRKVTYRKNLNKPELDLYPLTIKIYRNRILSSQQMEVIAANKNNNNNNNNNNNSTHFAYPLLNYVSASMFGSTNSSTSMTSNTPRHHLVCSYFVSQYQTVRSLAEELSIKFGKPFDEIRLWMRFNENDLRQIDFESIDEITCQEAGFNQNSEILLEIRNNDLTWPEELYTLATRSKALAVSTLSINNSIGNVDEEGRGQIGLSNLGNTCFLNAAVQCLSHSFPLTFYFLHKYHLFEINKDNPIGMQGNIALCYGQLIAKLWGNVRGPLAPFELRGSVAKFGSSRFTDFQQHDSQEFLSFLLDGLHEDLNRVHDKPYVELKDSDDRPDEDVANEHWSNHLARNSSIIVDLFHGLLRSQVKYEPPPAYEINSSQNTHETAHVAGASPIVEAPPPYCLVDPSKIRNMDHIPHHPHITPVEIIDLGINNNTRNEQSFHHNNHPTVTAWFVSGSNMDIGTDCTFLMAFIIAFFFNWLGFLAVVCLIPTIAARFGAMSGFGLSVAKWITVMRYHEFNNTSFIHDNMSSTVTHRATVYDPAQNFLFAIVLFAGFFLFIRGLLSYIAIKNRANQQGQTAGVFTWY
ncbi:unnamed protein product [Rotaria sp. Silwood2]|nr:unnamed protein product [Rotaria sp. Silwood2]